MFKALRKWKPALDVARVLGIWANVVIQAIANWGLLVAFFGTVATVIGGIFQPSITYPIVAGILTFVAIVNLTAVLRLGGALEKRPMQEMAATTPQLPSNYTKADRERLADALRDVIEMLEGPALEVIRQCSALHGDFYNSFSNGDDPDFGRFKEYAEKALASSGDANLAISGPNGFLRNHAAYSKELNDILQLKSHGMPPLSRINIEFQAFLGDLDYLRLLSTKFPPTSRIVQHFSAEPIKRLDEAIRAFGQWRQESKDRAVAMREHLLRGLS